MHDSQLGDEVVHVLASREHSTESPSLTGAAISPLPTNSPVAALPKCSMPQHSHTHLRSKRSVEFAGANLCSKSSSRSSSPGIISHDHHQRQQYLPRLQQQQQQQQQQPLELQGGGRRLTQFKSLQGSSTPSAPSPWTKSPLLTRHRSAEQVCTPDPHARHHHHLRTSDSSSVRSSSSPTASCHQAHPKRAVTFSPQAGHAGPSSLPNLSSRAASARRTKLSPMHMRPQLQQQGQQKQQARVAPRQPLHEMVPSFDACPNGGAPFAVTSKPQRSWKCLAQDETLSGAMLASAEEKLRELAHLEGEKASDSDWQGQTQMGPHLPRSPTLDAATQGHLLKSRSEPSLSSLPAVAHSNTQNRCVPPDCAQTIARAEFDQQQQQQSSNMVNNLASSNPKNVSADLDPAITDADPLKLCIGMLRGTEGPPSNSSPESCSPRTKCSSRLHPLSASRYSRASCLNQSDSFGGPGDSSRAGSRLSKPAGRVTLSGIGPKEGGHDLHPWGSNQAEFRAAPDKEAHQDGTTSASQAYHKVALQGSSSGSDLSSWRSCSSLLPSECSADSLTYQDRPLHQHNLRNLQCHPPDGLQLVDGAKRRARWKGNSSNAKALPPLQDGANSATGRSPSPPKVPLHRQSSKCLWATNAAAFDEEAAELEEKEYLAALQKAHESLERESPEFMMAVAQLQAYRPIFIPPDRKAKIETARLGEGNAAGRAPGANDNEEIEQIVRRQHEEALKRLLAREAKAAPKSKGSGLREHKHSPEERSAGKQLEKEEKTACKQVPQKEVAGWEPETTVSEQGVSGSVHNDGEHAAGVAPPDWRLAREKQEEAKAAATAARMSATSSHRLPAAATKATAAAAAAPSSASRRRVNAVSSGDEKEPWKMWKLSASAGMEGGFALAPGEIPADGKPPSWKPFGSHGSLDPDLHIGSWGSKESPAEDKPPPWKPVGPSSNLDHYSGSWGSKEPPPDEKPPVWKPVPPRNPDHYDGSWGSKSPEHSRSSAVFPDHWRPFWHSNPVDWSYLRPIDNVPEQKSKAKEPMWRL